MLTEEHIQKFIEELDKLDGAVLEIFGEQSIPPEIKTDVVKGLLRSSSGIRTSLKMLNRLLKCP